MPIDLIITDLTEMSAGNYCVAGWDSQAQRMVRPLPNGQNWTGALLQQNGVLPGATIRFTPTGQPHHGAFPHSTEDTQVDAVAIQNLSPGPIPWFDQAAPPTQQTLQAAFGGNLQHNSQWNGVLQSIYVAAGTHCCSLAAVRLPRNAIQLVQDLGKLKAILDDGNARYRVSVSSNALKTAFRQGGVAAAQNALPAGQMFHVRLGLARPFGNLPDKCYLMVNGIHG